MKRASALLHECAAESCSQPIPSKLLMCLMHWRMVPKSLQTEIYRTYRLASVSRADEHWKAYDDAVEQAVAAVREKEIQRQLRKEVHGDVLKLA